MNSEELSNVYITSKTPDDLKAWFKSNFKSSSDKSNEYANKICESDLDMDNTFEAMVYLVEMVKQDEELMAKIEEAQKRSTFDDAEQVELNNGVKFTYYKDKGDLVINSGHLTRAEAMSLKKFLDEVY